MAWGFQSGHAVRERDYVAYFESESFRKNSGIQVDPGEFVGRFRRGEPLGDLVRI